MTAQLGTDGARYGQTLVELTWREKQVERWIRFGKIADEHRLDRFRRLVYFSPNRIFGLVRWAGNEHGTVLARIDIVRAVVPGEPCQTVPHIRPGADILLRLNGWPKVRAALKAIDGIEARGIDPAEVSPDHWRHLHNRIATGEPFRTYTPEQHRAWLRRRELLP